MTLNIVDLVKQQIGSTLAGQIAQSLGEDNAKTNSAIDGAIPSILGGLISSTTSAEGRDTLTRYVDEQDTGLLGNLGSIIGGDNQTSLIDQGSTILNSLLGGGALSGLVGAISRFSGIGSGSTGSLLGIVAPIIMSVISQRKNQSNLDSAGLMQMLSEQQTNVSSALPAGLRSQLSDLGVLDRMSGNLIDGVKDRGRAAAGAVQDAVSQGVSSAANQVSASASAVSDSVASSVSSAGEVAGATIEKARSEGSFINRLLPIAAILGALFIGWKFFLSDTGENAVNTAGETATAAVSATLSEANVGDQLSGLFSGTTDALGNITDVESAKAALPQLEGLSEQVNTLSDSFGSLPESVRGPAQSIIGEQLPALQALVEKVLALPGVGDVLQPVLGPIVEKLNSLNA